MLLRSWRCDGLLKPHQALRLRPPAAVAAAVRNHLNTSIYLPIKRHTQSAVPRRSCSHAYVPLRQETTLHRAMSGSNAVQAVPAPPIPPGPDPQTAAAADRAVSAASRWSHASVSYYLAADRNWRAVEEFYTRLVSGDACLSQLGLAPAGAPARDRVRDDEPAAAVTAAAGSQRDGEYGAEEKLQQQQQQQQSTAAQPPQGGGKQQQKERRTFKAHVSYLGSSFVGWSRQPGHNSVEETLAAAIAAAGLTGSGPAEAKAAKRAAARAARRAQKRAKAAQGDITTAVAESNGDPHAATACNETFNSQGRVIEPSISGMAPAVVEGSVSLVVSEAAAVRLPVISVAGRTDSGVTAAGQVISFQSWDQDLQPQQLLQSINNQLAAIMEQQAAAAPPSAAAVHTTNDNAGVSSSATSSSVVGDTAAERSAPLLPVNSQLRVWAVEEVPRRFHATFSATWRRYVYLLPLRQQPQQHADHADQLADHHDLLPKHSKEVQQMIHSLSQIEDLDTTAIHQMSDPDPARVNNLLQQLQGRTLDYHAYARDTPKGKACECVLRTARATVVQLPMQLMGFAVQGTQAPAVALQPCLCIELVGNRFLRRMVRVLVATAVREALIQSAVVITSTADVAGVGNNERLVELASEGDRTKTAAAAPGLGLCFAAVGFDD